MPGDNLPATGSGAARYYGGSGTSGGSGMSGGGGGRPVNLGDILERVLDKGLVIAGDIQINLLDIELLTIKLRLVIASLETAREVGINWWENDPWLSADASRRAEARSPDGRRDLRAENRRLHDRIRELESGHAELEWDEAQDGEVVAEERVRPARRPLRPRPDRHSGDPDD
jgi:Gas vesicle protein